MKKELDPQLASLLRAADEAGVPDIHSFPYPQARDFYVMSSQKVAGPLLGELTVSDESTDDDSGAIPLRIYRPQQTTDRAMPALIYLHGGGWCIGNLDSHDHVCRWLARHSGCIVIAVDYRLGPEHKFPAAVDDAWMACQWIATNARKLNIDKDKLAIGGDSAGGNLSAVVCMLAREQGGPQLNCQLLIYPATDMLMRFPSHSRYAEGYRLTRTSIVWFINGYLRDGEDMYDFRASPLLAANHADLPPAFIITAGFDPLVDEGEAYAKKLRDAGVSVKYKCYEGMVHGFIAMPGAVDMAQTALKEAAGFIKRQLCK